MKKKVLLIIVLIALLATPIAVFAGAKNAVFFAWTWNGDKSGYWQLNKNGLVNGWSYERGDDTDGPIHFVLKPRDKFPNATSCDPGAIRENPNWIANNLHNALKPGYEAAFASIFGTGADLFDTYLLCGYPIE